MDITSIQTHLRGISGVGQLGQTAEITPLGSADATGKTEGGNFKDMLADSIGKVNDLMNQSDQSIDDLATGKSANVHHTLIALQKADVSFRMLLEVRNKVMSAYQDVMRMQA